MALIVYKPKYSIDTIIRNFASKRASTSAATFVANNFVIDNTPLANTIDPNSITVPSPVDLNLVSQIMLDYGDGPISVGMKQCLEIINQNVQTGEFVGGNIFGDYVIAGGNTDFRYVSDDIGTSLVIANLQMTTILPLAAIDDQTRFNTTVLEIVRDLRKGVYDYNNYLASIKSQSRSIARIIMSKYGPSI